MILLGLKHEAGTHAVLAFGMGLIGMAMLSALRPMTESRQDISYDWNDGAARVQARAHIQSLLSPAVSAVSVVWTGGRSGFGSTEADMAQETALLSEILDFAANLRHLFPHAQHALHVMSSAGGLFEGQTFVDGRSRPSPMRPYGAAKLQQEDLAHAHASDAGVHIYRPSSVYGVTQSGRVGLVTVLIGNALRGVTTRIVGNASTLRDYINAEDLGRFVANRVASQEGPDVDRLPYLLACGRSATMTEIISHVEAALATKLLLQFSAKPENAHNMSFRPSALPPDLRQTDLATGITRIASQLGRSWARHA